MKKIYFTISAITIALLLIAGCSKDDKENVNKVNSEDVATDVGQALKGITSDIVDAATISGESANYLKSKTLNDTVFTVDTTFEINSLPDAAITYNYTYDLVYGYIFKLGISNYIFYSASASGEYSGPLFDIGEERESDWIVTGLDHSSTNYILNGSTTRTGSTISKSRTEERQLNMNSTAEIALSDILINKDTYDISGGTMNWVIQGKVNNELYSYKVTVKYLVNNQAELIINGTKYVINTSTGVIE